LREGGGARGSTMAKPAWMVQREREDTVAADAKAARSPSAGPCGPLGVLGRASSEGRAGKRTSNTPAGQRHAALSQVAARRAAGLSAATLGGRGAAAPAR
jgi:hypothetical protein